MTCSRVILVTRNVHYHAKTVEHSYHEWWEDCCGSFCVLSTYFVFEEAGNMKPRFLDSLTGGFEYESCASIRRTLANLEFRCEWFR